MDRKPATIPIAKADKAKARSEDIRPIYIGQLLSQGIIIFGSGLVEGTTATIYAEPREGLAVRRLACSTIRTAQAGCATEVHMESQTRSQFDFRFGNIVKVRRIPLGQLIRMRRPSITPRSIRRLVDSFERNAAGM